MELGSLGLITEQVKINAEAIKGLPKLYYGTVSNGGVIVDGSTEETSAVMTCDVSDGDRVVCVRKRRDLIVIGNITNHAGGGSTYYYGTSMSAPATVKKICSITGFPQSPYSGLQVTIAFIGRNEASNPTLSVNGGTAKPICSAGTTSVGNWDAGTTMILTYNSMYEAWIRS